MEITQLMLSVFAMTVVAWIIKMLFERFSRGLPPGPWGLPLLGYAPFLDKEPYKDYFRLKEKYGSIYGFYIGSKYMVILNDFEDIKEACNKDEFLDRPDWFLSSEDKHNNLSAMNGWEWRETRKFILSTLRTLGMGKNKIEEAIKEEIFNLTDKLERNGPDAEIDLMQETLQPILNIILAMTYGSSDENSEKLLRILTDLNKALFSKFIDNQRRVFYPYLKPFVWIKKRLAFKRKAMLNKMKLFVQEEVEKQEREFDENNIDNFVRYYLKEIQNKVDQATSITRTNLMGNTELLLQAATDTTRVTLTWIFMYLARYQEAQEKMYQEIVGLMGKERPPCWEDKDVLPFTNAFILEATRMATIIPAENPHMASRDGTVRGYHIPRGTILLPNIESVHMDPRLWGDPENFRPERFLSRDGKKALVPEYWIPFLTGKRMCPGDKLANMQVFMTVAIITQKFQVLPPKSGLNMDMYVNFLRLPKKPLVSFSKRL